MSADLELGISLQNFPFYPGLPGPPFQFNHARIVSFVGHRCFEVSWANCNPSRGVFIWDGLDEWVAMLPPGRSGIYVLNFGAAWHVGGRSFVSTYEANEGLYNKKGPYDIAAWVEWCGRLAERYTGRFDYEIANEPGREWIWEENGGDGGVELAMLTRLARETIKPLDPGARILSPSNSNVRGAGADSRWVRMLSASDGRGARLCDHLDVLSVHTYPKYPTEWVPKSNECGPEHLDWWMPNLRAMVAHLPVAQMPIWATECGYITFTPFTLRGQTITYQQPATPETEARRAAFFRECVLAHQRAGVQRLTYFIWDGGNGMINSPATIAVWDEMARLPGIVTAAPDVVPGVAREATQDAAIQPVSFIPQRLPGQPG